VKTIQPAVSARRAMVARFEREMVILQRLNHPGIVRHLGSGESEGLLYFVMEYVEGTDACRVVEQHGPMDEGRVMRLAGQLLDALEYAHAQGVIHRDIKPANLLLSGTGDKEIVKLADFGLARPYQESMSELTLSGESGGSPGFMAPEQVTDLRTARPTADQYGVAATLYFLLTGKTVIEPARSRMEMMLRSVQCDPIPLRAGGESGLRGRLAEVIRRALARRPEDRYEDVRAMRAALVGGP
jgi:serine/threonine-protein kinase